LTTRPAQRLAATAFGIGDKIVLSLTASTVWTIRRGRGQLQIFRRSRLPDFRGFQGTIFRQRQEGAAVQIAQESAQYRQPARRSDVLVAGLTTRQHHPAPNVSIFAV